MLNRNKLNYASCQCSKEECLSESQLIIITEMNGRTTRLMLVLYGIALTSAASQAKWNGAEVTSYRHSERQTDIYHTGLNVVGLMLKSAFDSGL